MPQAASIELDEQLHAGVKRLASRRGQAVEAFVRDALSELVRQDERRAAFHADASKAWRDYQATGQHATFGEVEGWLSRLEAGEDAAPPESHS